MRMMFVVLAVLAGCDADVLIDVDGGVDEPADAGVVADAGVPVDAGFVDEVDAGSDEPDAGQVEHCDVEDIEVPFECEPDADWCNPRDQNHAYYDLAAGWSRQLDEETWVVEIRTWGQLPYGVFDAGRVGIGAALNGSDLAANVSYWPHVEGCNGPETLAIGDRDSFSLGYSTSGGLTCERCPPTGAPGVGRECENRGECSRWQVSTDLTIWRVEIPLISDSFFWLAQAGTLGDGICHDNSGPFAESRGGSADNVTWMSPELVLVCPADP